MILEEKMFCKTLNSFTMCSVVLLAAIDLWPQESKPPVSASTYKLDYVFSELQDNRRVNARSYTVLLRVTEKVVLKIGSRVPIVTGNSKDNGNQIQYLDVGANIDCRVKQEFDSGIELMTSAETTTLVAEPVGGNQPGDPVIRGMKYELDNVVPLGKQTLLGSGDEVDGTRRLQIEVTATKVR
jgi:hypothetical protein